MKIGLLGGSFNPIHIGHIELAKYTISYLKLDKLIFIPAFKSLEKLDINYESSEHRLNLIKLVMPEKTEVSLFELNAKYPVPSFETIKYFKKIYPTDELFFLIGEDCLKTINIWEGIEWIKQKTQVVVWQRYLNKNEYWNKDKNFLYLNNPIFINSSSAFRLNKSSNKSMLDERVWKYICKNNLYGFSE